MTTHKLTITLDYDETNDDLAILEARYFIDNCLHVDRNRKDIKISLTRENDRSAKNILLPKIEGRLGDHYPSRKATLAEVFKEEKND